MAWYDVMTSPLGGVFVGGSARGLHRVDFIGGTCDEARYAELLARDAAEPAMRAPALAAAAVEALNAYFEGRSFMFNFALAPRGTEFQRVVWDALLAVAPGDTATYRSIATAIGRPTATRAVGQAIGHNPIAVVVPCHRIIGADGTLTGYVSGLDRKRWLLAHEAGYRAANLARFGTDAAAH